MRSQTLRVLLEELGYHVGHESYGPWATGIPGRVVSTRRASHPDYRRVHEAMTAAQRGEVGQVLADHGFGLSELSDLIAYD